MGVLDKIMGMLLMVAGVAIWSIDYFIVRAISAIGTWIADLLGAPASVGTGITILITIFVIGVLIMVIAAGAFVMYIGYNVLTE